MLTVLVIDRSHSLAQFTSNAECRNCFGCLCHFSDVLAAPCQHTVQVPTTPAMVEAPAEETVYSGVLAEITEEVLIASMPPKVDVKAIKRQAGLYGIQIRQLAEAGLTDDRQRVWEAWIAYRDQFRGTYRLRIARSSYYAAYRQG